MGVGSGLGAQLAIKPESTFGTFITPDLFLVGWLKGLPKFTPNRTQGGGLYAGEAMQRGDRYVETTRSGSGTITFEVSRRQLGIFLAHITGSTTSPVQQGGSAAYLQTHAVVADNLGKSMTIQGGVPQTDGTVKPYTFLGCKITKATFSCGIDEILTCEAEFVFRDMTEAQSLAAASYLTSGVQPFHFKEMGVKLGSVGAEAAVQGVRKVTVTIERPYKSDRFYAGNSGLMSEPITNGPIMVTGSLEVDYVTKVDFVDRFVANSSTSMVLEWIGPIIASTFAYTTRFTMPQTFFTGDTPEVDGPDVVSVTVPFESKYNGTNAGLTAVYMSTDTVI